MYILEDLQGHIGNLRSGEVSQLVSFTTRSRHRHISIMYVMHTFGFASNSVKNSYDKLFLGNTFFLNY